MTFEWAGLRRLREVDLSSLYSRPEPAAKTADVIGWWEARRIPFNLIVGVVGLLSCMAFGVVVLGAYLLFDIDWFPEPFSIFAVPLYGFLANICYTGGWMAEVAIRRIWPREAERFALASFRLGLQFSLVLTATPGVLAVVFGVFGLAGHLLGVTHKEP
jgi:hypothetical protein